ncbi:MAG TPA: ParB/RepB/Spo0J family partition protein [Terriglobales bacterium]|nr:ParB/RepB/Spo0J family partition protein [Terriglobales bacterium]
MTTSNAAVDKTAEKTGTEKVSEKLAEKRRALGRGLESLLPGPRVVTASPTLPQSTRKDGAPTVASSQFPVLSSQEAGSSLSSSSSSSGAEGGRAGTPVAPPEALPGTLDELQAVASGRTADGETVFLLALDQIDPNPYQTRREFDQELLAELADSIRVQGVLQPVVVRPGKEGRFILILGERRLRASRLAEKTTIPVIVRRVSEQQAAEMTLVENLQREDLNCVEQAEAFANLSTEFKLTQEEIGTRAGVSRETVSNYMRLLALPEGVIGALQKGQLTYSHARALLQLRDNVQIWTFAKKAIEEKMSVAKLEDLVLGVSAPIGRGEPKNKGGGARWVDPNVKAAQRSLETVLGMRVRIRDRNGRGKILIEYATLEDFDRVVRMLKGK